VITRDVPADQTHRKKRPRWLVGLLRQSVFGRLAGLLNAFAMIR
jgi:hypothetical protein